MGQTPEIASIGFLYEDATGTYIEDRPDVADPNRRAVVTFHHWHAVDIDFTLTPAGAAKVTSVAFHTTGQGPDEITARDLRLISIPDLIAKATPVVPAPPRVPKSKDPELLERVAEIHGRAGAAGVIEELGYSRSRAYGLIAQAREAGQITTEGNEDS